MEERASVLEAAVESLRQDLEVGGWVGAKGCTPSGRVVKADSPQKETLRMPTQWETMKVLERCRRGLDSRKQVSR